jgi:hypothetical protein
VKLLLEHGADLHAWITGAKHHTNYRCKEELERLQIYSGGMARAETEKSSTRPFYVSIAMSDLHFDLSMALREEASCM